MCVRCPLCMKHFYNLYKESQEKKLLKKLKPTLITYYLGAFILHIYPEMRRYLLDRLQ